ncbi:unnamed protein product, partial [Ectocarpus sp. 6 AP-2014]
SWRTRRTTTRCTSTQRRASGLCWVPSRASFAARSAVGFRIRRCLCRAASRPSALSASGSTSTARRPAAPVAGSRPRRTCCNCPRSFGR